MAFNVPPDAPPWLQAGAAALNSAIAGKSGQNFKDDNGRQWRGNAISKDGASVWVLQVLGLKDGSPYWVTILAAKQDGAIYARGAVTGSYDMSANGLEPQ